MGKDKKKERKQKTKRTKNLRFDAYKYHTDYEIRANNVHIVQSTLVSGSVLAWS